MTPDRKLAVTYIPSTGTGTRELTVGGAEFPGPIAPRWFNPTTGQFTRAEGSALPNRGLHRLHTPGDNGTQANDWVLILEVVVSGSRGPRPQPR